jgi:hypothetical protein
MPLDSGAQRIGIGTRYAFTLNNIVPCFGSTQQYKSWHRGDTVRACSGRHCVNVHTTKAATARGKLVGQKAKCRFELLARHAPE